jgi:hypothetical protein
VAVLAYAAANVLHEGVGHGGACVLVGGAPQLLTSANFECGTDGLTPAAVLSYASGAVLYCLAGALNPTGPRLLLISAAAASLGDTSGLWWGTILFAERPVGRSTTRRPASLEMGASSPRPTLRRSCSCACSVRASACSLGPRGQILGEAFIRLSFLLARIRERLRPTYAADCLLTENTI